MLHTAASSTATKVGSSTSNYAPKQTFQAKVEKPATPAPKKTGPIVETFDPELMAILGAEF